ncbi:hypothetical protein MXB_5170 [Myxobolus squamalis]|nr:hypothetical protein MXB_5170 [Myxobolus squamalis]
MNRKYLMYVFVIGFLFLLEDAKSFVDGPPIEVLSEKIHLCNYVTKLFDWPSWREIGLYLEVKINTPLEFVTKITEITLCPSDLNRQCSLAPGFVNIFGSSFTTDHYEGVSLIKAKI